MIDIVKVKTEIKKGRLRTYVKYNPVRKICEIYLTDTENGGTVLIGEFDSVTESVR